MPVFRMLPWKPIIAALPVVLNNSKLRSPIRPSLRLTGQLKLLRCKLLLTTQYNHCERSLRSNPKLKRRLLRREVHPHRNAMGQCGFAGGIRGQWDEEVDREFAGSPDLQA